MNLVHTNGTFRSHPNRHLFDVPISTFKKAIRLRRIRRAAPSKPKREPVRNTPLLEWSTD